MNREKTDQQIATSTLNRPPSRLYESGHNITANDQSITRNTINTTSSRNTDANVSRRSSNHSTSPNLSISEDGANQINNRAYTSFRSLQQQNDENEPRRFNKDLYLSNTSKANTKSSDRFPNIPKKDLQFVSAYDKLVDDANKKGFAIPRRRCQDDDDDVMDAYDNEKSSDNSIRQGRTMNYESKRSNSPDDNPPKRRQLGTTARPRFISPLLTNKKEDKNPSKMKCTDERLKNIDPLMIEMVMNEIMDLGAQVKWDDICGLEHAKQTIKEIVVLPMLRPGKWFLT